MSLTQSAQSGSKDLSLSLNSVDMVNNLPGSVLAERESLSKTVHTRVLAPLDSKINGAFPIIPVCKLPKLPPIQTNKSDQNRIFQSYAYPSIEKYPIKKQNEKIPTTQEYRINHAFKLTLLVLLTVIALCSIIIVIFLSRLQTGSVLKRNYIFLENILFYS